MRLTLFIISAVVGMWYILAHYKNNDPWGIAAVGTLMIISYLLFMATLPKETNLISHYMSDIKL